MEIELLSTKATVNEIVDVSSKTVEAINNKSLRDSYLDAECIDLDSLIQTMRSGIGDKRGKALSSEVLEADMLRDNLLAALNGFIRSFQLWNNLATSDAAYILDSEMKFHSTELTRWSYEKESGAMDALLERLASEKSIEAAASLGLTELVADLRKAQSNFNTLYMKSARLESQKGDLPAPSSLRKPVIEKLRGIINYLNAMSKAKFTEYGALAALIAELVNSLNSKISSRYIHVESTTEKTS